MKKKKKNEKREKKIVGRWRKVDKEEISEVKSKAESHLIYIETQEAQKTHNIIRRLEVYSVGIGAETSPPHNLSPPQLTVH